MNGPAIFRLLGDEARLRLLRLLAIERLNVSELTGILGIAQSGVSRHLGLMKDAGLITEEREAGFTYFRVAGGPSGAQRLRTALDAPAGAVRSRRRDRDLAAPISRSSKRSAACARRTSTSTAGPDTRERQLVPGRSWAGWSRALGHLLPPSASPTSVAARVTSPSRRAAGRPR